MKSWDAMGTTRRNQMERKLRRIDELEAEQDAKADLVPLDGFDATRTTDAVNDAPSFLPSVGEAS